MSVCLDYQSVYHSRRSLYVSVRVQLATAIVLLLILAFKVWMRIESTNIGYMIAKERQVTVDLDMERREYELQLSVLKRNDRLSKKAQATLGLKALNPKQAKKIAY